MRRHCRFHKAAEQNDADAQYNLIHVRQGKASKKPCTVAWFKRAAEQGHRALRKLKRQGGDPALKTTPEEAHPDKEVSPERRLPPDRKDREKFYAVLRGRRLGY